MVVVVAVVVIVVVVVVVVVVVYVVVVVVVVPIPLLLQNYQYFFSAKSKWAFYVLEPRNKIFMLFWLLLLKLLLCWVQKSGDVPEIRGLKLCHLLQH